MILGSNALIFEKLMKLLRIFDLRVADKKCLDRKFAHQLFLAGNSTLYDNNFSKIVGSDRKFSYQPPDVCELGCPILLYYLFQISQKIS